MIPSPILTQKEVCDKLVISYAGEIQCLLPKLVNEACTGCKNNIDRNTYVQQHDDCVLTRKKRLEIFTEMALLSINENSVHGKVTMRLKRHATFNGQWVHEDRQSLMAKKNWVYKLKMYMFDL